MSERFADTASPAEAFLERFGRALDEALGAPLRDCDALPVGHPQPGASRQEARIVAALSGGCDSVVLAWALRALLPARSADRARDGDSAMRAAAREAEPQAGRLLLAHVHHGLRRESDEEERFVRSLAEAWGLEIRVARIDVRAAAAEHRWSREQAARILRLRALEKICRDEGLTVLALGHQMDDQAETMLLRLLRGTGPRGLGAMAPAVALSSSTKTLEAESERAPVFAPPLRVIRPLLGFRRALLREVAQSAKLEWREDRTNLDPEILRNRIRLELLPHLAERYNPRIVESLADLARRQRIEREYIAEKAAALKAAAWRAPSPDDGDGEITPPGIAEGEEKARPIVTLDAAILAREPDAVASQALWLAYQELAGPEAALPGRRVEELLDLARRAARRERGEVHLPGEIRVRARRGRLLFEPHVARP